MNRLLANPRSIVAFAALVLSGVYLAGCGFIADKDRIVVAKVDGKNITRGDLAKYIHDMDDEARPLIQNKADLLETLNAWINGQIESKLAEQLKKEGKIEASRDVAREKFFEKYPEFRVAYQAKDAAPMGISQGELNASKAEVEFRTDDEEELMLREEALSFEAFQSVRNNSVVITADDLHLEFDRRKDELIKPEMINFFALQLPLAMPDAIARAADARRRIDAGEKLDDVLRPYVAQNTNFAYNGVLENDPSAKRFKSFWDVAHGAAVGQIIGPVLLPEHDEYVMDPQTQKPVKRTRPAAQLVLEVLKREPERPKTFEEAANELALGLARTKVIDKLRAEHGVEVYVDKLPDPAGVGDQYKDSMIETGRKKPATP